MRFIEGLFSAGLISLDNAVLRLGLTDKPDEEVAKILSGKHAKTAENS